ncbi:DUF1704 domain-containing protein [Candidatus Woesebacteria bacterium]|nr:DUF1704 domain-containing protein [Candidatus Woesebacteria bacterium]
MLQLKQLIPLNYQEEKDKFFSDTSRNPQFIYADDIDGRKLTYYGVPTEVLVEKAERIAEEYLPYQSIKLHEKKLDPFLTQQEITKQTVVYLERQGVADRYTVTWSDTAIARCAIQSHRITFRSNADYTSRSLNGVLNHEIGTHALRRINDEMQPWHGKKRAYGFANSLLTEEGLATLHQHLDDELPALFGSAVRYLTVHTAQSASFVDTWKEMKKYYQSKEKLWTAVFRAKRGIKDTTQPGGFTKDLVYFEGSYKVSLWLRDHDLDISKLYLGRLSIKDVEKAASLHTTVEPILPFFITNDAQSYKKKLLAIIRENDFSS